MNYIHRLLILVLLLLPSTALANLNITEVMYDPEGADKNREWIEIYNAGDDITLVGGAGNTWRLYEESLGGNLSRRTFSFEGEGSSVIIPSETYAVIARNSEGFRKDFPTYDGLLFFSTASLTNSDGRRLSFYDADGNEMGGSSRFYIPLPEASGTGASLQLQEDGRWIAGLPTPGLENTTHELSLDEEEENENENETEDTFLSIESDWPFIDDEKLFLDAGENRRVFAGEKVEFKVRAQLKSGEKQSPRSALWAFGNGDGEKGASVKYSYPRAGVYRVLVRVEHSGRLYQDALLVQVLETSTIELERIDSEIVEIKNNSAYEVELSDWYIKSGDKLKAFALGTHVLPHSTVAIPFFHTLPEVSLHDSQGNLVNTFSREGAVTPTDQVYERILNRLKEILEEAQRKKDSKER
ncbi:MAG: lamin tail domain-containing protein [Candidatus Paceibacterota bacterium]